MCFWALFRSGWFGQTFPWLVKSLKRAGLKKTGVGCQRAFNQTPRFGSDTRLSSGSDFFALAFSRVVVGVFLTFFVVTSSQPEANSYCQQLLSAMMAIGQTLRSPAPSDHGLLRVWFQRVVNHGSNMDFGRGDSFPVDSREFPGATSGVYHLYRAFSLVRVMDV